MRNAAWLAVAAACALAGCVPGPQQSPEPSPSASRTDSAGEVPLWRPVEGPHLTPEDAAVRHAGRIQALREAAATLFPGEVTWRGLQAEVMLRDVETEPPTCVVELRDSTDELETGAEFPQATVDAVNAVFDDEGLPPAERVYMNAGGMGVLLSDAPHGGPRTMVTHLGQARVVVLIPVSPLQCPQG